jgi:hypothetical protein
MDTIDNRMRALEDKISKIVLMQEVNTQNISNLTRDLQLVITNSPTIAVMETRLDIIESKVAAINNSTRKLLFTLVSTGIIALVGTVITLSSKG